MAACGWKRQRQHLYMCITMHISKSFKTQRSILSLLPVPPHLPDPYAVSGSGYKGLITLFAKAWGGIESSRDSET